jgi:hypothetical protein
MKGMPLFWSSASIGFAGKSTLGNIDFFRSFPRGFMKQDEGSDLFVEFLLRPQRPLLDILPLVWSPDGNFLAAVHSDGTVQV